MKLGKRLSFSYQLQGPEGGEEQGDDCERGADECHRVVSQRGKDESTSQTSNCGGESYQQIVEALRARTFKGRKLIGQQCGAANVTKIPSKTK